MTTPTLRDDEIRALRVACAKAKGALDRFVVLAFNTLALGDALNGFARLLDSHDALARKCEAIASAGHEPTCGGMDESRCGCGWLQRRGAHRHIVALESENAKLRAVATASKELEDLFDGHELVADEHFVRDAINALRAALAALPAHDSTKEE